MTTCKPLDSVARVTELGSAAFKRDAQAVSRNSKGSRALNFTSFLRVGEFSPVAFFRRTIPSFARRGPLPVVRAVLKLNGQQTTGAPISPIWGTDHCSPCSF